MNDKAQREVARREATAWFVKLDADEVSSATKAAFFSWLDRSSLNQSAYIEVEQLWSKLAIANRLAPEPTAFDAASTPAFLRRYRWLAGTFASVLMLLGLFVLLAYYPPDVDEFHYATAVGERADYRLDDGSLLQLNTDSAVSVRMEDSLRLLTLERGEVYFDIAHDPTRPFIVNTAGGAVKVLGTQFNIRQTGPGSVVSVLEGRVAVSTNATNGQSRDFQPQLTLTKNQQTVLLPDAPLPEPVGIESNRVLAWRDGKLIYDGNTLAEVIADLNRHFPGTIALADASLGQLEIVGVLNLGNRQATLAALEATFGIETVEVSPSLTLVRRAAPAATTD